MAEGEQLLGRLEIACYPGMLFSVIDVIGDQYSKEQKITLENLRRYCEYKIKGLSFLAEIDWGLEVGYRDFIERIAEN